MITKQPMPTVSFDGKEYSLKSRNINVPALAGMDRIGALLWLNQNTVRRGFQKARPLIAATLNA